MPDNCQVTVNATTPEGAHLQFTFAGSEDSTKPL